MSRITVVTSEGDFRMAECEDAAEIALECSDDSGGENLRISLLAEHYEVDSLTIG